MGQKLFDNNGLSELLGMIYDSVQAPARWGSVLERYSDVLRAKAASVNILDPVQGKLSLFVEHGTDPAWTALLMAKYAAMSPIGAAVLCAELDQPVSVFDFIDEPEFVDSRFYREWCLPQGYHDMLGALIAKRPSEIGSISATRSVEAGRFEAADRAFVTMVAPHVRRAVTISGMLEQRTIERDGILGIIDHLAVAVLIVDSAMNVVRTNPAGEALCIEGVVVKVTGGKLGLPGAAGNRMLEEALVSGSTAPQLVPVVGRGGEAYIAAVLTVDGKNGSHAVLFNRQLPDIPAIGQHLSALFGMTPREIAVLMPLLEGRTIDETAAQLGIANGTARTHLKHLLTKTRTNRQSDLVQVVMKALPPVRVPS